MTALLIAAVLTCGQYDADIAIAIAIHTPQPAPQSVVVEPPTRLVTKYRLVRVKRCINGRCSWVFERRPYTERVPSTSTNTSGYPLRPSSTWWTGCTSWRHLTTGKHAGLFDQTWLRSLSWAELQSLHSDHHTGRVQWDRVIRP